VLKTPLFNHDFGVATFKVVPRDAPYESISTWMANALAAYPVARTVVSVAAPRTSPILTDAVLLTVRTGDGRFGFITVDPHTAQPLGFFFYGEGVLFKTLDFHRHFLLPDALEDIGEEIVAWSGIVLLLSIGSGLYLWWPRAGAWRQALMLSRGPRFLRSLHNVAAVYLVIPLALLAISGIFLAKPEWLGRDDRRPQAPGSAPTQACDSRLDPDQAVAKALQARPGSVFVGLSVPRDAGAPYAVRVRREHGSSIDGGATVVVDPRCGAVLSGADAREGTSLRTAIRKLHADLMLGIAGQALVFASGLALPVLYVSGLMLWLRGRRQRRQRAGRTRA
jgi:uncharacterized iron-regulated membrane protein